MVFSIRNFGKTGEDGVRGSYVQDVETVKIAIVSGGSAIIPYFVVKWFWHSHHLETYEGCF